MIIFKNEKNPTNLNDIEKVEKLIGLEFPNEYKEHILAHNGGQCFPNIFKFIEKGAETNSNIDWFLAIYDGQFDNLEWYVAIYKLKQKRLPINLLPIANDPGGNLVCISCLGKDYGSVYFWDHENEVDYEIEDDTNYSNLYLVSHSFKEFLESLSSETI
ncbi:MAG: SMI1/KNR4 family protein [Ignavibacteriaceae bacterium]|nr:SMI1/KNR4 family protein [Ignavibacteriaceae bacterium]